MTVLPQILLVVGVSTLLALWCGWGLARLTLPASLKQWSGLLALLLGYALVLVVGYWAVRDWAGVPIVLTALLPLGGLINIFAWVRTGPPRLPTQPLAHAPLAALLAVTFLVGVAPLLSYGHPAIIGDGWDVENYLPVARYLERGPVSDIAISPPNPLRDLNANPPSKGLTLGFSIWQSSVDVLTGQEALTTFAPILAWLRMLGVMAVYILFRATLGLKRWFALLGAAFVSAGGLLLWIEYVNFGMQISAWPLIPLGLVIGIEAVKELAGRGRDGWPLLAGAGIALAALPVAYYPALTLFAPLAVGLGGAALIQAERRLRLLLGGAALAVVTLLLSVPAILAYNQGFSDRYSQQLTTLGLFRYVPLTDFAGLTTFSLRAELPVSLPAIAAFIALCALMLAGLFFGRERAYWAGFALGGLAYMAWLWSQQYPYAWMKGGAYAAFPFLGLAAAGVQAVVPGRRKVDDERRTAEDKAASRLTGAKRGRALSWGAGAVALSLLVLMGLTQAQTVADHWQKPGLYAKELPAMLDLRARIPAGSSVTLTSDPRINGVTTGLAAYMLDHTTILGNASTGYVPTWSNGNAGESGDYALLLAGEDPGAAGFGNGAPIWLGGGFALYQRSPNTIAHIRLDRTLSPGEGMDLPMDSKNLGAIVEQNGSGQPMSLAIAIAALEPGKLTVEAAMPGKQGGSEISIPAGGSRAAIGGLTTPQMLTLRNSGGRPVTLRYATLMQTDGTDQIGIYPDNAVVLARALAQVDRQSVITSIQAFHPDTGPVTLALDIWDPKRNAHYGWYGIEQQVTEGKRTVTLTLDIATGTMTGKDPAGANLPLGGGLDKMQQGDYIASLNVQAGTQLLTAPEEVFSFSIGAGGAITGVRAVPAPLIAVRGDFPTVPLDVAGPGDDVQLLGYSLGSEEASPGREVSLTLWWRSAAEKLDERSILLYLRDAKGEKRAQADGPPANGGRPTTTWRKGETVIDRHDVKIPDGIPPGMYSLAVGMYHYPSLEAVPLTQRDVESGSLQARKPLDGNVVLIPLDVKP